MLGYDTILKKFYKAHRNQVVKQYTESIWTWHFLISTLRQALKSYMHRIKEPPQTLKEWLILQYYAILGWKKLWEAKFHNDIQYQRIFLISSKMLPSCRAYKAIPEIIKFLKLFRVPGIGNWSLNLIDLSVLFQSFSHNISAATHIFMTFC